MILSDPQAMVAAAIAARPALAGLPTTIHDGGWDSVAVAFGDAWLCKFPRDEDGPDALRQEVALLAALRPHLSAVVPEMTMIAAPVPFTCHRLIPGDPLLPADYAALATEQRDALASAVGGFLAELHAAPGDWAALGIAVEDEEPVDADAVDLLPSNLRAAAERTLRDAAVLGPDPLGEGLCYLDAHGRNFAFDHAVGRLTGIFDFGDVAIAGRHEEFVEPAYVSRDFALRVIAAYEAQTRRTINRGRVETLIGAQRLRELADDADHPVYGEQIIANARDWFARPHLASVGQSD